MAVIVNDACPWFQQAGDGFQGSGFACAVTANERDNAAGSDAEGNTLERADGAVVNDEIFDFEHGLKILFSHFMRPDKRQ
jgi:hypothetical protein